MPMSGMPSFMAWSMILVILRACMRPSEPPATVKSWAKMQTGWPEIVPVPVMTPSPGRCFLLHAEVLAAVLDEEVVLVEGVGVEDGA